MYNYKDDAIPLAKQFLALEQLCNGKAKITDNDRSVVWEGAIKPLPFSRTYGVHIKYTIGSSPKCIVTSPALEELTSGRDIPHIYEDDKNVEGTVLCLFLPKIKGKNSISEWQSNCFIADTIIPWAALWLSYFEEWLHSNEWRGGGEHPEVSE